MLVVGLGQGAVQKGCTSGQRGFGQSEGRLVEKQPTVESASV